MPTIRTHSSKIRFEFAQWLALERAAGARFVVVEGLMNSGKSELTKQPETLSPALKVIELDKFVRRSDGNLAYMDTIDVEAVTTTIKNAVATASLVIAEGPMAWPVTKRAREGMQPDSIRRVYLKRLAPRNPDDWEALEFAQAEDKSRGEYFLSIDRYHVKTKPWLAADLILERIGRDDVNDKLQTRQ